MKVPHSFDSVLKAAVFGLTFILPWYDVYSIGEIFLSVMNF